ncbi:sterol desaturase/sphingolipid hydroxylase (fatty acid hydroxylase superfamily) [Undibacterium sp. GrIS 1.2]|uniref:sterol desaturase family protein n=1 Tax=Undibacterium sp. GrIS 1.2 TaxID=3143933 RepID=UPI0033936569
MMRNELTTQLISAKTLPWIFGLLLIILLAATIEGIVLTFYSKKSYDWRAYAATAVDMIIRRLIDASGISIAAPILFFAFTHRINTVELSTPFAFVLLFIGQEFFYYWYHRTSHTVRWFWATHSVHHSPNELNLAAAMRLGWTGKLTGTSLFFTPLVWLGFAPTTVLAVVAINLLYQFWIHAPWIPTLGPLEWVLNTPAHHSVHHASNPEYLDCNYGGVLIIFDRLFGTFRQEQAGIQIRYGLTERLYSYNPIKIALHEWSKLVRDLWSAKTWLMRIKILFGPPGTVDKEYGSSTNTIHSIKPGTSTS